MTVRTLAMIENMLIGLSVFRDKVAEKAYYDVYDILVEEIAGADAIELDELRHRWTFDANRDAEIELLDEIRKGI